MGEGSTSYVRFRDTTGGIIEPQPKRRFFIGVDVGQSIDPSAICILERVEGFTKNSESLDCVHLERLPLGLSYPTQVQRLLEMCLRSPLYESDTYLAIDATGCGRPVFDMFRQAGIKCKRLTGVLIHGGDETTHEQFYTKVPKRTLVSGAIAKMQTNLRIAKDLAEVETLRSEMQTFEMRLSEAGHDSYNARSGAHDDLLMALCLAVWQAGDSKSGFAAIF